MVEPSNELSEPNDRVKEQPLELRSQADLVIQEFERMEEYNFAPPPDTPIDISIERLKSKNDLLNLLGSSLLPQLQHQCARLSELLWEPSHMQNNPASTLKLISEIQARLHLILSQIIQTRDQIFPGKISEPYQTNDQRFDQFKIYRLHRLDASLRADMKIRLRILFQDSIKHIQNFKRSTTDRSNIIELTYLKIDEKIDLAISFIKGSELRLIWELWKDGINKLNYEVEALVRQMDPINALHQEGESPLSQPAIKLGRSILPIFKLSRLCFKKLYRANVKMEEVELFTEMCSHQLVCLHATTDNIVESISNLSFSIQDADRLEPGETTLAIFEELDKLIKSFQSYFSLISLYVLPNMFPNPIDFSHQIYFQNWIVAWTTSFLLATHNAIQAVQLFADT
ncbi:hypothetical protein PGT21_015973 [Puccinia graminis f. sp. tritici]|uniref:Uncharacterized protein n=2 Tax=Puccinia graminis f. sp. tritici TaxID=56615 RepID=E3KNZ7_PUCGT|nr:uncharacterized protein PGTG_11978 [Puccinia graminis f. sp. tritici CRL 75-36-700-3]EFP86022.1 hypothetical protein PGTG_11978 [Puccinia graminis f. sp. tritici CRL 75-36-700-3]KAA1101299.1 hypothetical protein PGT21_015973 [Puccinia graminis f. sp. tritici]